MKLVLLLLTASASVLAADNSRFLIWNSQDLKGYEQTLHSRLGPDQTASLRVTDVNGHPVFVVHREATAQRSSTKHFRT